MLKITMTMTGAALAFAATAAFAALPGPDSKEAPALASESDTDSGGGIQVPAPVDLCSLEDNTDALIGVDELSRIFMNWGVICEMPCGPETGDYNSDGQTDVSDLILVVTQWGACPEAADEGRKSDQFADDFGDGSAPEPGEPGLAKPPFSEEVGS